MASTVLSLHYHLVFSSKDRYPFIQPQWQARLFEYMGGTIKGLGGFPKPSAALQITYIYYSG